MASITNVGIAKLTGRDNYNTWKFAVKTYLEHEELWECVEASSSTVDAKKDLKAKSKIILLVDPLNYVHIQEAKTAKEVWNNLEKAYDDSGLTRKVGLLRDLITTNLDSCSNIEEYVNKVMTTAHKLRNIGFAVDDEWLGTLLLAGLPETYKPMIMAIESSGVQISADSVKTKILQDVKANDSTAFYTNHNKYRKPQKSFNIKPQGKGPRCYSCNKYGHYSSNCQSKKKTFNKNDTNDNACVSGFVAAFSACSSSVADDIWYIDSGASMHMTRNKGWMYNCKPASITNIKTADNKQLEVKGCGNVNLKVPGTNNQTDFIQVKDVLYVPNLATNLLSVSQMTQNGCQLQFTKNGCNIFKNNKLILTAKCLNNMYVVNDITYALHASTYLWHQRLGHLNFTDMAKIENSTTGAQLPHALKTNSMICITCLKGKQTRQPFKHEGSRATDPLGLIHSDICGPMENKSLGGARYFITFIDDFTRKVHVYFLKSKAEALDKFKEFKNYVENQLDKKIKILRTDNGKEYVNEAFGNFIKQSGILHQKTNPYTPEQNGLAERMNRTLIERAKCMLINSSMPKIFWAESVSTGAYIINRTPTKSLNDKTPEEMWSKKKPDISNLKIFGCKAMVHIPKEKRLKWDSKSQKLIFVGYCHETKGYRLYDESKKQIIRSRNVVFLEGTVSKDYVPMPLSESKMEDPHNETESTILNDSSESHSSTVSSEMSTHTAIENLSCSENEDNLKDVDYVPDEDISSLPEKKVTLRPRVHKVSKENYTYNTVHGVTSPEEQDPYNLEIALSSNNSHKWKQAMDSEYKSLIENNTWTLTDLPAGKKAIPCKWVYKTKLDADGNITKYKARLVIKGYEQRKGIDYEEVFAPVVRHTSMRYLFGLAAKHRMKIDQMDAVTAFLQGDIDVELYMTQPPSYENGNKMCKLNKSIYGLKQASRRWNLKLNNVLQNMGLMRSKMDPCVYYKIEENIFILTVYVDDLLLFYTNENEVTAIKQQLKEHFKMQDLGKANYCIGLRITYIQKSICIDQTRYIEEILRRFHMYDSKPVSTPMEAGVVLSSTGENILQNVPYQEAIGCLLYLCQGTRPDIAYTVNTLSKFSNKPELQHWQAVKRLFRYLRGTKNMKIVYTPDENPITGYCDSDWASNSDDRRSCTGYVFIFQGAAISWNSRRQQTIALSTTEAEYMALSAATQEALWLRQLHLELWPADIATPMKLYCDNQSAIKLSGSECFQPRSKHIDVRHHFVRDRVARGEIQVQYVSTNEMTADSLTKATPRQKHEHCVGKMGLYLGEDIDNKYNIV